MDSTDFSYGQKTTAVQVQLPKKNDLTEIVDDTVNLASQVKEEVVHISSTEYRPDIDGLRAIAVSIVIFFHAWPEKLTGGFIGVDVFFVISGYFITQILVKQNLKNAFSYFKFYNRRVKRIYPALIAVLLFVLQLAIRYSDLAHTKMTTKTMAASTIFGANIEVMTYKQGYWDASVKTNPLLHLWSLGVQEQFYIIWPLLITITITKFKSKALHILLGYTVFCFILNIIAVYISAQFAFYFPFCRFWQMAVGGVLAFKPIKVTDDFQANTISVIGLIVILVGSFFLSELNLYPGWWALLPTLASAAVILAGPNSVGNKLLLSSRVMVFIGKISYSLYLWHWPLLVFSRALFPQGSDSLIDQYWFIALLTLILFSISSYYFIENPIRFAKSKRVFFSLLIIMCLIGATSFILHEKPELARPKENYFGSILDGAQMQRYINETTPTAQDYYQKDGRKIPNWSKSKNRIVPVVEKLKISGVSRSENLFIKVDSNSYFYRQKLPAKLYRYEVMNEGQKKLVVVYGDSHASYSTNRFMELYQNAKKENRMSELPTLVIMSYHRALLIPQEENHDFFLKWVKDFKPDRVLLIYLWINYRNQHGFAKDDKNDKQIKNDESFYDNIGNFAKVVKNITQNGAQVYTNNFQPYGHFYMPSNMYNIFGIIEKNIRPIKLSEVNVTYAHLANYLVKEVTEAGAKKVLNFTDHSCWEDQCHLLIPSGYTVYADDNHWSAQISRKWLTSIDFFIQFTKE